MVVGAAPGAERRRAVNRAEVERMLDAILGRPWRSWSAALSLLIDMAVLEEEAAPWRADMRARL